MYCATPVSLQVHSVSIGIDGAHQGVKITPRFILFGSISCCSPSSQFLKAIEQGHPSGCDKRQIHLVAQSWHSITWKMLGTAVRDADARHGTRKSLFAHLLKFLFCHWD